MSSKRSNKLIVVLGMHRSGTSAVTRGLVVAGVSLGDRLMPAAEGNNQKGFWEDIDFNELNIEILNCLNGNWDFLTDISQSNIQLLREIGFFEKAKELIKQKVSIHPIYGLKDPRMARLMPFWREVFNELDISVFYIIAIRNPLSVVHSLAKRDQLTNEKSYLLWLVHVISILVNCDLNNSLVIDYDQLMASPIDQLNRISEFLGQEIDKEELGIYRTDFLDNELQHNVYTLDDLKSDLTCSPLVLEIYSFLKDLSLPQSKISESRLDKKTKEWNVRFRELGPALKLIDSYHAKLADSLQTIHGLNLHTLEKSQSIVEKETHINNLDRALLSKENHISVLDKTIYDKDIHISNLNKSINEKEIHIAIQEKTILAINQALKEKDIHISNLDQSISLLNDHLNHKNSKLNTLETEISTILNSTSWKVTQPLRSLGRVLRFFFPQK